MSVIRCRRAGFAAPLSLALVFLILAPPAPVRANDVTPPMVAPASAARAEIVAGSMIFFRLSR